MVSLLAGLGTVVNLGWAAEFALNGPSTGKRSTADAKVALGDNLPDRLQRTEVVCSGDIGEEDMWLRVSYYWLQEQVLNISGTASSPIICRMISRRLGFDLQKSLLQPDSERHEKQNKCLKTPQNLDSLLRHRNYYLLSASRRHAPSPKRSTSSQK